MFPKWAENIKETKKKWEGAGASETASKKGESDGEKKENKKKEPAPRGRLPPWTNRVAVCIRVWQPNNKAFVVETEGIYYQSWFW